MVSMVEEAIVEEFELAISLSSSEAGELEVMGVSPKLSSRVSTNL